MAVIKPRVFAWLAEFHPRENAGVVYWSWLDAGGPVAQIEKVSLDLACPPWPVQRSGEVYRAWLDAGQPLAPIEGRCASMAREV